MTVFSVRARALLRLGVPVVAMALVAPLATACGGDSDAVEQAAEFEIVGPDFLPGQVLDLTVGPEPVEEVLADVRAAFVDAVGFYGFRQGELLQATLQLSRFGDDADWRDPKFRNAIVTGISATTPQRLRMGGRTVFLSTSLRQQLAIWFDGRWMFVLAIREEYEQPRALLREVTAVEPPS